MTMMIDPYRFATSGDPDFAEVVLLLTANTNALVEWAGVPHVDVFDGLGVSGISAAQVLFDESSYHNQNEFTDHTNYIDCSDDVNLNRFVFDGLFTMEGWFYRVTDGGGALSTLFANSKTPSPGYFFLGPKFDGAGNTLVFAYNAASSVELTDLAMGYDEWLHVAITRDEDDVVRVFLNGVPSAIESTISGSFGGTVSGATHFTICEGVPFVSADFDGYFDQIRVTRGVCRYTGAFTPPAEPFPTSGV